MFVRSLENQIRVLKALIAREIHETTGRGAYKLAFLIVEPIVAVSIAIVWHTLLKIQPPYGNSRVLFIASGLYPTYIFVHVSCEFRSLSKGSTSNRRLPVEMTIDHVLAACIVRAVIYGIVGFVGFAIIYRYFSPEAFPSYWPAAIVAFLILSLLGLGMGLCNAAIEQLVPVWRFVWNPIARGLILFSGVIYVPDFLRPDIRYYLSWNPVLQGVEKFRQAFYPGYPRTCFDGPYIYSFVFLSLLVGLALERAFHEILDEA